MTANDFAQFLRARPFRPFRVIMTDGAQYEVRHPELAIVSPTIVYLGFPNPGGGDIVDNIVHLSVSHMTRIEPITQPSSTP